eukprot:scaffold73787_cov59-Phaeocystis_antarctica.AAC.1
MRLQRMRVQRMRVQRTRLRRLQGLHRKAKAKAKAAPRAPSRGCCAARAWPGSTRITSRIA